MLFACGYSFSQPAATTQTHPLYPLNVGDKWTYRNVDLKKAASTTEPPKETVIEVERQEIYSQKVTKDMKVIVTEHVGFILKSTSGGKTSRDHVVILEDGVRCVHRAGTLINPPLNLLKFPLKQDEKWDANSTSGNAVIKGTYTWRQGR